LAISRIVSRNRMLCEAAFTRNTLSGANLLKKQNQLLLFRII